MTQSSLPTTRQIHQILLGLLALPLPMPTAIRTPVRHPHTVQVWFEHGTGDGGDAAAALDAARTWIAALDARPGGDQPCDTTWQTHGYGHLHGWSVSITAVVDLADLDVEHHEHYVAAGSVNSMAGWRRVCSCGWRTNIHCEPEDADGEMREHLRLVGGGERHG